MSVANKNLNLPLKIKTFICLKFNNLNNDIYTSLQHNEYNAFKH